MSNQIYIVIVVLFFGNIVTSQNLEDIEGKLVKDTLSKKELRASKKEKRKIVLKESGGRFVFKMTSVFADLKTTLTFDLPPNGLLTANIGLEQNLGLPSNNIFLTGSTVYFFTPRSGLFAQYYGIQRNSQHVTDKEYTFLDTVIPIGTEINAYFNTNVFSVGYLLTVLREEKVYLGMYLSFYFMDLDTGFYVKNGMLDEHIDFVAPLPNFGLVASFGLTKWLDFDANIGFFSISLDDLDFSGGLYNISTGFIFKPTKWLGINASYELFDVNVKFLIDEIPTSVSYRFKGPALGLSLNF